MTGTIRKLVTDKKYGFIRGEDNLDYFFHAQDLDDQKQFNHLFEGMKLEFEPSRTDKGLRATEIELIEG